MLHKNIGGVEDAPQRDRLDLACSFSAVKIAKTQHIVVLKFNAIFSKKIAKNH